MANLRFWLIKKLVPDYRTKQGQDLAVKLWHWTSPHIEHAGYEWTWSNKPTGILLKDYPKKGYTVWSFVGIGEDLTIERIVKSIGKDNPNCIQVTEWQHRNVLDGWDTFRGIPIKSVKI